MQKAWVSAIRTLVGRLWILYSRARQAVGLVPVAAELDDVRGVDEEDIAGTKLAKALQRQLPAIAPFDRRQALHLGRHHGPRLGIDLDGASRDQIGSSAGGTSGMGL